MAELDIQGLLAELVREEIEFLVIGGVAVGFHGYVRATKDIDIVPSPSVENLARLAKLLRSLDATVEGAEDFNRDELPNPLDPDVLAEGGNWVLETNLGRFDVMQWIDDEALWQRLRPSAIETNIDGLKILFVGYDDLVVMKERAGRPEDLADLAQLREARGES